MGSTPPPIQPSDGFSEPPVPLPGPVQAESFVERMIPTRNGDALLAYYMGLFSIAPCLGLALGPMAIYYGRRGLRAIRQTPGLPGKTHAIVGLAFAWIGSIFNYGCVVFLLVVSLTH